MNVELSHNPYTIRTKIVVDGETVTIGKLRDLAADDHRLQMWIDRFFPCLLDVYDSPGSLNVTFQGTQEDYDDLCEAAQAAKDERGCAITVSLRPTRDPENILQGLKRLFEEAKTGPIPEFRDADLDSRFQECVDPDFEVSVIATMKAGKSTFLNAMIGRDLLPEDIEACTATVTRVRDTDGLFAFRGRRLCSDSSSYTEWQEVSRAVLEEWNKDDIRQIEIEGDVPCIVSEGTRLVLVDTPGPNNARNANHGACLVSFIKKDSGPPPMVLYLLNAKTLFTNDNQILLQMVSEEMKKAGKQSRDRFMFVMTHADAFDADKGATIEDRMDRARCYLANYDINAPNLFPINGLFAKLVRCQRNGEKLTKTERREIDNWVERCQDSTDYKYSRYMTLSPSVLTSINDRMAMAKRNSDDEELALLYSGVPAVEEVIQEYLRKYAIPAKIHDAVKSFEHVMQRTSALSKIQQSITESRGRLEETHKNISCLKKRVAQGNKGKEHQKRLETMVWKKTPAFVESMMEINKRFLKYRTQFEGKLGKGEVELKVAKRLLADARADAEFFFEEARKMIGEHAQREVLCQIERMRKEYVVHVEDLLGSMRIEGGAEIGKQLTLVAASIPSVQSILREFTYEKDVLVGDHWERKTFSDGFLAGLHGLFGGEKKVSDYETRSFVNMKDFAIGFLNLVQTHGYEIKKVGEDNAKKEIDLAKSRFLKYMGTLDEKIMKYLEELEEATRSEENWKRHINENEAQLAWYGGFKERLDALLAL